MRRLAAAILAVPLGACAADVRIRHSRAPGVVIRITPSDRLYARTAGAAYLLQPAILRWEERTEWSGKQDRVRLRLTLYEVASGQPLDAAYIHIESPKVEVNEHRIGALLRDPLVRYAGGLF
jgi:hypothetical protein